MVLQCECCHKQSLSLRRCTGCLKVYYCSKNCQRQDWVTTHKFICKDLKSKKSSVESPTADTRDTTDARENIREENPGATRNTEDKTPFAAVFSTDVCSGNIIHEELKLLETGAEKKVKSCKVCGKIGDDIKRCVRCKETHYCSKACQYKDWPLHKQHCHDTPQSSNTRTSPDQEHIRPTLNMNGHAFIDPSQRSENELKYRATTTEDSFEKARALCRRWFPFCIVLDDINDIPNELFGIRPGCTDLVLVAFISRYHHYRTRHCVYVEDAKKKEIYVAFYLDFDIPFPFFSWQDVAPGNFICIQEPSIHYFLDGSVGIRVEEAENVKILFV